MVTKCTKWNCKFDSRQSQTEDIKLVVKAPLSNDRHYHIKGSSMQKLVDPLPE